MHRGLARQMAPLLEGSGTTEDDVEEGLQFDLEPYQVVERIEQCALWLVDQISTGNIPDFVLSPLSATKNSAASSTSQPPPPSSSTPTPTAAAAIDPAYITSISLAGRRVESADRFARLWSVLSICHEHLVSEGSATQRELYYRLNSVDGFNTTKNITSHGGASGGGGGGGGVHRLLQSAIQDAVLLLRVPRSSLGINCSSKGLVTGPLMIRVYNKIRDLSTGGGDDDDDGGGGELAVFSIPGTISTILTYEYSAPENVVAVLIIEKDTVFQQLKNDPFLTRNFILVTGKGVPDLATRVFLSSMHSSLPHIPLLGLVDWNPSGVSILNIYRHGSPRMAESRRYALPDLRWLGIRSCMLNGPHVPGSVFQELSERDKSLIPGLKGAIHDHTWHAELDAMLQSNSKADIEAVYSVCGSTGLGGFLLPYITRQDWI